MTETGVDAIVPWAASRCITQWKGERGLKSLGEPEPDLRWWYADGTAYARVGPLQERVRLRAGHAEEQPGQYCSRYSDASHEPPPKRGRKIFGKRSSRKKWSCPSTPTFFPVRALIGRMASRPT